MNKTRRTALLTLLYWVNEGRIDLKSLGFTKTDLMELELLRKQLRKENIINNKNICANDINVVTKKKSNEQYK